MTNFMEFMYSLLGRSDTRMLGSHGHMISETLMFVCYNANFGETMLPCYRINLNKGIIDVAVYKNRSEIHLCNTTVSFCIFR